MDDILNTIVAAKQKEVAKSIETTPMARLEKQLNKLTYQPVSLASRLQKTPGIIAEFKRASPSKGIIATQANPDKIAQLYSRGGAAAISVLTDQPFFKAQPNDFYRVRAQTALPILRKEFIIDAYQLYESRIMGADVVLLIAALLTKPQLKTFTSLALELGMEVLVELHTQPEIDKLNGLESLIGINNRNLRNFEVNIEHSMHLKEDLKGCVNVPIIAESGLKSVEIVKTLLLHGFSGFLMGEYFMKQANPQTALEKFTSQL